LRSRINDNAFSYRSGRNYTLSDDSTTFKLFCVQVLMSLFICGRLFMTGMTTTVSPCRSLEFGPRYRRLRHIEWDGEKNYRFPGYLSIYLQSILPFYLYPAHIWHINACQSSLRIEMDSNQIVSRVSLHRCTMLHGREESFRTSYPIRCPNWDDVMLSIPRCKGCLPPLTAFCHSTSKIISNHWCWQITIIPSSRFITFNKDAMEKVGHHL